MKAIKYSALIICLILSSALLISCKTYCKHDDPAQIVSVEAKDATCQETGLTSGMKCNLCGTFVTPQAIVPVVDCIEGDWKVAKMPTHQEDGERHIECTVCKKILKKETLGAGSYGLEFSQNNDGTYTVTSVGSCTDTEIVIPKIHNEKPVTGIGERAFQNCDNLTCITIPDSVTSIGKEAFYSCSSLTSITIPDSVTYIGKAALIACRDLTSITLPFLGATKDETTDTNLRYILGIPYSNPDSFPNSLKTVIITGGTNIGNGAFEHCANITNITIPNSITNIGSYAFYGCQSLTNINIPNSVTSIGQYAFSGCASLTGITIPDSVKTIDQGAFEYCESLTNITIPNSITNISNAMFSGCYNLMNITIPNSVTSIGNRAFNFCANLTSITIPNSVTTIGDDAFELCMKLVEVYNLSSLNITKERFSNGNIGYYSLNIYTPTSGQSKLWTTKDGFIFYEDGNTCYLMGYTGDETHITLPESCHGKNYAIYDYAFFLHYNLVSITINKITSIGRSAFEMCYSLTSITFKGTVATWTAITKGVDWNVTVPATEVICSDGTVSLS